MVLRCLTVLALAPTIGCTSTRDCSLEAVLERWLGSGPLLDCGQLEIGAEPADFQAAHNCAVGARAAQDDFYVSAWDENPMGARYFVAYFGREFDGIYRFHAIHHSPAPDHEDENAYVYVFSCTGIRDLGYSSGSLGLECRDGVIVEQCLGPGYTE